MAGKGIYVRRNEAGLRRAGAHPGDARPPAPSQDNQRFEVRPLLQKRFEPSRTSAIDGTHNAKKALYVFQSVIEWNREAIACLPCQFGHGWPNERQSGHSLVGVFMLGLCHHSTVNSNGIQEPLFLAAAWIQRRKGLASRRKLGPRGIVDGRSVDLRFTSGKWATLSTCPPEGSNRMAENWSR